VLTRLPDALEQVRRRAIADGLKRAIVDELAARIVERVESCQAGLNGA
jgi:hypothetical protein